MATLARTRARLRPWAAGAASRARPSRARPSRARSSRARSWRAGAGPGLLLGLGLGLLALGPGLRRGFLLSYDMVFVPREPFASALAGISGGPPRAVPSDAVVAVASRIMPADIVQKLVLLAIFVLACGGVVALLDREPWFARLAGGVFYAWNPFVAERLIIGQWALLLGYAGLPWALRAAATGRVASWRGAGRLGLALLPAAVGGFAAMCVSALVVLSVAALARGTADPTASSRDGTASAVQIHDGPPRAPAPGLGQRAASVAAALAVLIVASLPWLIPSLLHAMYADPAGAAAFAARADTPFGAYVSVFMLGGMWNAQTVPAGYGGWWSACWLCITIAAAAGYLAFAARLRRWPGLHWPGRRWPGLGVAAVAGFVVACAGISGPGQDLLRGLARMWPGFAVLRDGQQFAAPLALAQALGIGLLAAWAVRPRPASGDERPRAGLVTAVALLLAPVLLLPGLAWGAAGRLRPVWYPAAWLSAAAAIDDSPASGKVLVLPWAAYRRPAWNGGRAVLDPWPRLLSRPVVWNDGGQVGDIRLAPDDPAARRLNAVITGSGPLTGTLAAAGIRFVVMDGDGGSGRLPGCRVLTARPGLTIWRVPGRPVAGRTG